ncbi:depupylase/deamidase Dop [Bifidobacterium sp. ESL0784]|uniref:depupylase/deamidase Dop n=1 Tax=Bifidobacterium sp. ESL0784 TaxID=2983231 RepID=UPI0023F8B7D3|nr:depupylase/deamidase Dop [Bifidobacterium sp. ESL0784]MDF7641008.1 depupylase/deamidase Dop [Bifidobacterium sp. ESL0784]
MSVRRMMGTETEYAVSESGKDHYNPVQLSFDVVSGAANPKTQHIRWDYRQEDPLNDARGTRLPRASARPDMLTDEPQRQIVNVIASNGGRVYVDHAHPEYSAPETMDPFEAVCYDHAGDRIMFEAAQKANKHNGSHIVLHRNNVDGKGASWGTHENYMMRRRVPFEKVAALMTLHFVSRQIYTGSGRVGIGEKSEQAGYQLSQRADYVHSLVGLQTTFDRPIVNARDESHVTGDYRRLHVIVGDANRMDVPQVLKLGATSMLLWLLEHAGTDDSACDLDGLLAELQLVDPVEAMHTVSHDLSLADQLPLEAGGTTTAWQIQVRLLSAVSVQGAATYGSDNRGEPLWPDEETKRIMAMWRQALMDVAAVRHASDDKRLKMAGEGSRLEWLLKWQLLERLRRKTDADWSNPKLAALDLSWAALDPSYSVFSRLQPQTERVTLSSNESQSQADIQVQHAMSKPPEDTRAWLRSEIISCFPQDVVAASWSHLTVRDGGSDRDDDGDLAGLRQSTKAHIEQEPAENPVDSPSLCADTEGTPMEACAPGLFSLDISEPGRWTRQRCIGVLEECRNRHETAAQTLRSLEAGVKRM